MNTSSLGTEQCVSGEVSLEEDSEIFIQNESLYELRLSCEVLLHDNHFHFKTREAELPKAQTEHTIWIPSSHGQACEAGKSQPPDKAPEEGSYCCFSFPDEITKSNPRVYWERWRHMESKGWEGGRKEEAIPVVQKQSFKHHLICPYKPVRRQIACIVLPTFFTDEQTRKVMPLPNSQSYNAVFQRGLWLQA